MRRPAAPSPLFAALVALAACGGSRAPACRVDADCASGACRADGSCAPVPPDAGGAGGADAGAPDGGGSGDAGSGPDAGAPLGCAPNHDGVIDRSEVTFAPGLRATFRIADGVAFSTAGATEPGGRLWDFTQALSGDHDVLVETLAPAGAWWAADFPGATYAAKLSDSSDLIGVFQATGDALLLLGVVSPSGGVTQTEESYSPPVKVLAFPLQAGATWTTTSSISGQYGGVWTSYSEAYATQVDLGGTARTPFGDFPALRAVTTLTRTVGLTQTTLRTFAFAAECFGVVATVVGKDGDPSAELTSAAEVRRLAP